MYRIKIDLYNRKKEFFIKDKEVALHLNNIVIFNYYAAKGDYMPVDILDSIERGEFITFDKDYHGVKTSVKVKEMPQQETHKDELAECMRFIYPM